MNDNFEVEYENDEEVTSISLVALLEDVITLVDEARSLPLSSNVVVNKAKIVELLNLAIQAVPEDIITADRVVSEAESVIDEANQQSEDIIEQARVQADEIIANAHEQAKTLVSSERVIRLANDNADKIVTRAEENARNLALGADTYCDERLTELEDLLEVISRQINAGREAIAARSGFDPEVEEIDGTQIAEENYPYDNE